MPDPKNEQVAETRPADPPPARPDDGGLKFKMPLYGGTLSGGARELEPGVYLGNTDYLFRNGDLLGAQFKLSSNPVFAFDQYGVNGKFGVGSGTLKFNADALPQSDTFKFGAGLQFANGNLLNADWMRMPSGQIYGADGTFKLGKEVSGTANFRVDEPANTAAFNTKLKFNEDYSLNGDWTHTAAGQLYGADGTFRLGKEGNGTANFRVDEPANTAAFNTKLKFNEDYSLNGDWTHTAAGQLYGADGTFKLGKEGNGTANFRVDEPANTAAFNTKLKFNEDYSLNGDWTRTAAGQLYGADGTFKLGQEGNGTASFRVDEPAKSAAFNTKLKFNEDYSLNGDWTRTAAGQLYGADGTFKLGKEGNGTANFRVDEPANTAAFNTKLKFNEDYGLNGDWTRTAAGQNYGADGTFKLGKEGNGTAAFWIDEPNGTSLFSTKLKFDESTLFNADFINTKNGRIYGADGTFGFGNGDKGTAGFRVDEPANTSSIKTRLEFANGNLLNFDLAKSPNGSVYGADGAFGLGQNGKGLASFRIDEPNQSSNYKLGASFDNGTAFNAQLMKDRLGTSLGLDGKFDFDKGAGSVMLDGKFGPRLDMGASVKYKNENLEYSGHIRANNEFGPFKVSEFGAKVSTAGNERYKFSAEAGYRPENNEYYGRVGITIQLGGGHSRPSRPITRAESGFDPERSIDDAASAFKEKQSTLLRPENKGLYEQAVSGVEKLNASGAKLPVGETAASLTLLAKDNGMQNIQYVALGNPTSGGQQNLFIGDGDPGNPAAKKAFIDKTQAATTPMQDSLQKIGTTPPQSDSDSPSLDQPQFSAQRRSAM